MVGFEVIADWLVLMLVQGQLLLADIRLCPDAHTGHAHPRTYRPPTANPEPPAMHPLIRVI